MSRNRTQKISYVIACHTTFLELEERLVVTVRTKETDSGKAE